MSDVVVFKQKDLVLKVNNSYDPNILDLDSWTPFIDRLCGDRNYQKETIRKAVIFLASNKYEKMEDLVEEQYPKNNELQKKYSTIDDYKNNLQLPGKLFANIDLATGTGKSFVIYGCAQILLGLGVVDKVLVLCPSLTIEAGLKDKFKELSGDYNLKSLIPVDSKYKNPRIIDGNHTIVDGDICIENIHAVYTNASSSIDDSLKGKGEKTLVMSDESHHIFNKISGNTKEERSLKKWKEFLLDEKYGFKRILGFTGTAYLENEYFNDVIYRYSLREAIEDGVIKKVEYVQKDDSVSVNEKFQKIKQNHEYNKKKYPLLKPLSILITKDISKAKSLREELVEFLKDEEGLGKEDVEKKVLIVTSHKDHKINIPILKKVDEKENPVEWIVSVSMLTEGWDVKNVFQIVPWEDKAFNSKLLISQVLGRGLRIPEEYKNPQPQVIVFNHDAWSKNIRHLINEIMEYEKRVYSAVLQNKARTEHNLTVYNLDYTKEETQVDNKERSSSYDYNRIEKEGISLDAQVVITKKESEFESLDSKYSRKQDYLIKFKTWTVDEILDKIFDEFKMRDWEGKTLQLSKGSYTQNNLPPREDIKAIIVNSMEKRGIEGTLLIEKNAMKILQAFSTLLRKKNKGVIHNTIAKDLFEVSTKDMKRDSVGIGSLRRGSSVFFTSDWENEIDDEEQKAVIEALIEDESLPRSSLKELNEYLFKTPVNVVITNQEPERKFVENLCKKDVAASIDSWIKSRDTNFYSIEYSMKYGGKDSKTRKYSKNKAFNPDFFIKVIFEGVEYILVIEIKTDKDDSEENKAKYKYSKIHFDNLNKKLEDEGVNQKYLFHFLSPDGYSEFFEYLKNRTILKSQDIFRCALENMLEES